MNSSEWSKEIFIQKPELVALFDRLARIGRAVQRARAKVDLSANETAGTMKSDIFGQLGWRDWGTDDAMGQFQQSLSREMSKLGVALPANTSEIGRKLERIYEFISGGRVKETLTAEQVEGNWANLEKLAAELKGLPVDSEERMRLFNQFVEVSDELWEAAAEVGLEWPQEQGIISQEMVGLEQAG